MRSPLSASLIFLGFTSSRFNLAHSFSTTVARMQDGKSTSCIGTATTTSLRAKTKNDDAGRNSNKNNKSDRKSTVAIIGGGIAGLSCARHLQHSYDVTVYDTGRLRPGGRASSRQPNDRPKDDGEKTDDYPLLSRFRFDHAAQFITSSLATIDEKTNWRTNFDRQVQDWIDQDVLRESPPNSMYVFEREKTTKQGGAPTWSSKCLNPTTSSGETETKQRFCYPSGGMSSLIDSFVKGSTFEIKQDVWVSPSSGVRYQGPPPPQGNLAKKGNSKDCWSVRAQGRTLGTHDHLIVAHNGKCADRLMSKTPARDVHRLLRTNFNDRVPANGGQKMTLNSIYSLTFCMKGPSLLSQNLPESFVGGFVQDHPKLGLVTCQTNKYPTNTYNENKDDESLEVWTILSTASFAKKNKAPQEFLPEDVVQNVTQMLVDSMEQDILGTTKAGTNVEGTLQNQILESRVQLWGAAVPLNVWKGDVGKAQTSTSNSNDSRSATGFIWDPRFGVGVCGDWLMEASIAGAWTSGRRLAQHLIDTDMLSTTKHVGFKKGHFEASQSVRQLGLASLDGPMVTEVKMQPTNASNQTIKKSRNGGGKTNRRKNNTNRSQSRSQKQTSSA